jgi:hypothetical protein
MSMTLLLIYHINITSLRDRRATVMEKERIAEAEEAAERQRLERLEQRKLESHQLLADQLKKDVMGEGKRERED